MKNILNKGLSILLSVAMLFAMVPNFPGVMANAEKSLGATQSTGTDKYWDYKVGDTYPYADFSPFVNTEGRFKLDGPYTIENAEQLAGLMVIVNYSGSDVTLTDKNGKPLPITGQQSFEGKTITISNDINLSAHDWVPIGKGEGCPFKATIQGKVNTETNEVTKITGMEIGIETALANYTYAGLIGVYQGPAISNIGIGEDSAIYISTNSTNYAGGIVGKAYLYGTDVTQTISNCYNTGTISGSTSAGGIIGRVYVSGTGVIQTIKNCYNVGTISGKNYAGGIVGEVERYGASSITQTISNCYNTGAISATTTIGLGNVSAGGIVGYDKELTIKTIENCYNVGTISGKNYAGGIVGYVSSINEMSNCYYMGATKDVGNIENEGKPIIQIPNDQTVSLPTELHTISNTSANNLNGAGKLGKGFAMVYYFELSDGTKIVPNTKKDENGEYLDFSKVKGTGTATLKGVKITQNALTESGYTGDTFYMYVDLYSNSTLAYKIVFETNGGEWKSGYTAPSEYEKGKEVTLPTGENISKDGYTFADWYDNAECTGTAVTKIPTDATGTKTFYAKWKAGSYKINKSIISGGQVIATIGENTDSVLEADYNTEVTLTVKPNPGYQLTSNSLTVKYNNNKIVELTKVEENKKYTFTMPAEDVTVSAEFEANLYNITNKAPESNKDEKHGYITIAKTAKTDEIVTLTVEPNDYYTLDTLTVTYGNNQPIETTPIGGDQYTFPMPAGEVTVSAEFELITGETKYDIKIDSNIKNGKVTAESEKAKSGDPVNLTVEPDAGYDLKVNSLKYTGNSTGETVDIKNNKFTMPAEDVTVSAEFEENTDKTSYDVTINKMTNGTVTADAAKAKVGKTVTLTVKPDAGYKLEKESLKIIKINGGKVSFNFTSEKNEYTFIMPADDVEVTASFKPKSYNITNKVPEIVKASNHGYITIAETAKTDETVTLTVKPDEGYDLKEKSLKVTDELKKDIPTAKVENEDNEYTFTMPAGKVTVSAIFEAKTYTITNNAKQNEEGTIPCYIDIVSTANTDEIVTLTVNMNEGYQLEESSLKVTYGKNQTIALNTVLGEKNEYTFTMPADDVTVSAEFEANPYSITNNTPLDDKDKNNGYIDIKTENGDLTKVKTDETVTLTVNSVTGYQLTTDSLKVTYGDNQSTTLTKSSVEGEENKYTFKMPAGDVTVTAEFELVSGYCEIEIDPSNENVTVTADKMAALPGEKVIVMVKPNDGYEVNRVYVNNEEKLLDKEKTLDDYYKFSFTAPESVKAVIKVTMQELNGWVRDPIKDEETGTPWWYYYQDGEKLSGWQDVPVEDGTEQVQSYYFNPKKGNSAQTGWLRDKTGNWHYFEVNSYYDDIPLENPEEGLAMMWTGWTKDGGLEWYYLDIADGKMKTGWLQIDSPEWYYLDENNGDIKIGWQYIDGNWYFFTDDKSKNMSYYGQMQTGWLNNGGPEWYYLDETNGKMKTGWTQDGGSEWYYLDENNGTVKIGWQYIDGDWYCFTDDKSKNMSYYGQMQTGWLNNGGPEWYYLDETNGKMKTGWTQDGGSAWYYLDATDGNIKLGWQFISGKWYYFTDNKSENMRHYGQMQTGWQFIGGSWYYFYADGAMAANTLIDNYRLDENGRWVA